MTWREAILFENDLNLDSNCKFAIGMPFRRGMYYL